ncbi:conserved phage C-terminal domain-containing protein, partial [Mangrovibacter plantisponsor]
SESGGDPSVNSTTDPSGKKPSCQVAGQPDNTPEDPATAVLEHFNQVTKSSYRDGKTTMGYIRGRLADMFTAEDLIRVTDYATAKWLDDPKMCDYLRPKTLFGPENFQEYHQKALKWDEAGRPACINGKWQIPGAISPTGRVDTFKGSYAGTDYSQVPEGFRS